MKRSREPEEESPEPALGSSDGVDSQEAELPASKITGLDDSAIDSSADIAMRCSLPPHREVVSFPTYEEYETHYSQAHTNRCVQCKKNFPSEHLLNVHFEDCHDAFAAVKREKGEHTYSCFVEACDRKCRTPYKRRNHLIDKHMYPKNYFFAVTKDGIDGRQCLLVNGGHHRRKSSTATTASGAKAASRRQSLRQTESTKAGTDEPNDTARQNVVKQDSRDTSEEAPQPEVPDIQMEDLAGAMSSLRFVPPSVTFGRGRGKAGFAKR
ncbi:Uu.00g004780.m01.CDS01 [Anthostomella pinea]|uniref:Uu.00g004780.m01.CDS01 n=1 Tax=Anthostomella pinea TaxID=933095 RepID=A0AAI8YIY9_9PEZI|nr:Uu.00g004780.m01.CDS01 [Anthostomella pinea]